MAVKCHGHSGRICSASFCRRIVPVTSNRESLCNYFSLKCLISFCITLLSRHLVCLISFCITLLSRHLVCPQLLAFSSASWTISLWKDVYYFSVLLLERCLWPLLLPWIADAENSSFSADITGCWVALFRVLRLARQILTMGPVHTIRDDWSLLRQKKAEFLR